MGEKVGCAGRSILVGRRSTLDEAYPGDVVGLISRDTFRIGDTISLSGGFEHKPLPLFQPEVFARVSPRELTKRKSFDKSMEQLIAEGTVQRFWPENGSTNDPLVTAVGKLQVEVLQYRAPTTSLSTKDARGRPVVLFMSVWDKPAATRKNPGHKLLDYS